MAQRLGKGDIAEGLLREVERAPLIKSPELAELAAVVKANATSVGRPEQASEQLSALLSGHALFQTHQALFKACLAAGRAQCVEDQTAWLKSSRGQAYAELVGYQAIQALNVADSHDAESRPLR
jgi:hypothetical protein